MRGHLLPRSNRSGRSRNSASTPRTRSVSVRKSPPTITEASSSTWRARPSARVFAGAMKRHNSAACGHRTVSICTVARLDRSVSGSRQGLQRQEDGWPYGCRPRHHAEPAGREDRCRPWHHHDQARSRLQGWLVTIKDAVKKATPENVILPRAEIGRRGSRTCCRRGRAAAAAEAEAEASVLPKSRSPRKRCAERSRSRSRPTRPRAMPRRRKATNETRRDQPRRLGRGRSRAGRGPVRSRARADILHRVVRWQRNKAQAGTHKVKGRSEVSYSTKKIYRQKGTGGARHGSRKAPIFRKGGIYKGPTPRSHAHDLPKKVRALGLKLALSAKAKTGSLVVINTADSDGKTKSLAARSRAWAGSARDHRRRLGQRELRSCRGQHRRSGRAAQHGRQRV